MVKSTRALQVAGDREQGDFVLRPERVEKHLRRVPQRVERRPSLRHPVAVVDEQRHLHRSDRLDRDDVHPACRPPARGSPTWSGREPPARRRPAPRCTSARGPAPPPTRARTAPGRSARTGPDRRGVANPCIRSPLALPRQAAGAPSVHRQRLDPGHDVGRVAPAPGPPRSRAWRRRRCRRDASPGCRQMNLWSCRRLYQLACPASRGAPRASLPSPDRPWQTAQAA